MTREEFIAASQALVGDGRGWQTRTARTCGLSLRTVGHIVQGDRSVPDRYAAVLNAALAEADRIGGCVSFFAPRLEAVLREGRQAGIDRHAALAAIVSWAALRLASAQP